MQRGNTGRGSGLQVFGRLVIDTLSDRLVYGVKSYGGVEAEVYADNQESKF